MRLKVLILWSCVLVAGCQTSEEARQSWIEANFDGSGFEYPGTRQEYVNIHQNLDTKIKEGILTGWPVKGMTIEQLHACLQTPIKVEVIDSSGYVLCWRNVYGPNLNEPATALDAFRMGMRGGDPPRVYYTFIDNKLDSWTIHK